MVRRGRVEGNGGGMEDVQGSVVMGKTVGVVTVER